MRPYFDACTATLDRAVADAEAGTATAAATAMVTRMMRIECSF
jgi:hypothetical protein